MYTQPKIHLPKNTSDRAYITFYYKGKRFREYNGNRLNILINPNQTSNLKDKRRLLASLSYEFTKALDSGWSPLILLEKRPTLKIALEEVLNDKINSNLSVLYKRNLKAVFKMFTEHLTASEQNSECDELTLNSVEKFLSKFNTSERNYINRRRCLSTLINEIVRKGYASINIVKATRTVKAKASLHLPYTKPELNALLEYLEVKSPNLHLCCLITYGCLLRPHHEIRILRKHHIVNDYSQIQLSGNENKSKRVRSVPIPIYIQTYLKDRLDGKEPYVNIFTLKDEVFNHGYFNVSWNKLRPQLLNMKLLRHNQTIYSFRHTAALEIYRKTKDLHILQQLLGHSDMIVTLKYLRGLGVSTNEELKNVMPEL